MYHVYNICGGCLYEGKSLNKATEAATEYFAEPYIHSAKGKRPVVVTEDGNISVGEYDQSYDEFMEKMN